MIDAGLFDVGVYAILIGVFLIFICTVAWAYEKWVEE